MPETIAGRPIKGQSRYSDQSDAGDREDMVLENDVVLGRLLEQLKTTDDPRWNGHKLIENTLFIFTGFIYKARTAVMHDGSCIAEVVLKGVIGTC